MVQGDRDRLIDEITRVARKIGRKSVPRHEFRRHSGTSERQVTNIFGSYNDLVCAAGLTPLSFGQSYSDDYILAEVVKVLRYPESELTSVFFGRHADISTSVCERRFVGWINTLRKASELLDPEEDRNLICRIGEHTRTPSSSEHSYEENQSSQSPSANTPDPHTSHFPIDRTASNLYGDFVNFRGLQHSPVNEQGVVFLFGMVCRELGYMVEIVRAEFPDCEAKRRVRGREGRWQRVRIEFEYKARNFRSHGHDPDQCDVIVCWEDNWPDCPIEVLELKSTLDDLRTNAQTD